MLTTVHPRRVVAALVPFALLGVAGPIAVAQTDPPASADATATVTPSTMVLHVTILTADPHPGTKISAQVWAATGTTATDAQLALSSSPSATITPICTLSGGKCHLGDLTAKGITIPLPVTAPSKTGTLTLKAVLTSKENATGITGSAKTTIT